MPNEIEFESEKDEPSEYSLTRRELSQAVIYNTDWTVETVISQLTKDHILLSPTFQRRDAWRIEKKSRFIESLLLGLPVPQIVLAEDKDHRGQYLVLDGKQRLLTLLQFAGKAPQSSWNEFRLQGMQYLTNLEGKTISELMADLIYNEDINAFLNFPIRSSIIRNWPNSKYLETVFVRLNEGSLKLSPQELRQALSPGPFSSYIDAFAGSSASMRRLLRNNDFDFRMRDTELMLRFLAFSMFPELYAGDMKAMLDEVTSKLNATWQQAEGNVVAMLNDIEASITFGLDVLGDKFARKWDVQGNEFGNRLNRAVAEIEIYYFRDKKIRDWIQADPTKFFQLFRDLTNNDEIFRSSVESTTKSMASVGARFESFGEKLRLEIDPSVRPLRLSNGRLQP